MNTPSTNPPPTPPPQQAGGAFVRPYALTRGRVRARHRLSPDTLLHAGPGRAGPGLGEGEYLHLADLCRERHRSVAELAGTLHVPLTLARVLISDLIDARVLVLTLTHACTPATTPESRAGAGGRPTEQLLEALRAGLIRKWSDAAPKAS
ncbi:DUF742 domain-containing protein [Streptomyces sp. NPDC090106]|uniref:DUF742 domain-containing protein n=1 Tax=Streptomyces sp. NPDC090106 TaxID=3365946 RepID=UPI00382A3C84